MSILRLKKCAIIAVNTIMSIWLIRAILFFVKTEHGKPILSDHIEDVKALIYILDTFEYIALFSFAYILVPQFGIKYRLVAYEDRYTNSLPMPSDMGYIKNRKRLNRIVMISLSDNDAARRLRFTPLLSSSKFPAFSASKCLQNSSIIQNNSVTL